MSSVCTLRLNRRSAFSRGSPSCTRTSAKIDTPPNLPSTGDLQDITPAPKLHINLRENFSSHNRLCILEAKFWRNLRETSPKTGLYVRRRTLRPCFALTREFAQPYPHPPTSIPPPRSSATS